MIGCIRCRKRAAEEKARKRGNVRFFTLCDSDYGTFCVNAAELILRLAPRKPVKVTARSLDQFFRSEPWRVKERHLRHVDNSQPGIFATLQTRGGTKRYLIEGFHRATNHRRDRTDWSAYILTPEETYAIMVP